MPTENLDKRNQKDFFTNLFGSINISDFIDDESEKKRFRKAAPLDLPAIQPLGANPTAPAGPPPPPAPVGPPAPAPDLAAPPVGPPPPIAPIVPPPMAPPPVKEDKEDKIKKILEDIKDLNNKINDISQDMEIKKLQNFVDTKVEELSEILKDYEERKIPKRDSFDTEGVYREKLYGLVTQVLDRLLPDLFEEIPDYRFIASNVSKTFTDGTVSDALVSVGVTVAREGSRYDFKIEVPILEGLIQFPQYISRGIRIIPLLKDRIQRELSSMSYRKMNVDTSYNKEKLFSNFGENVHRKQDNQKAYPSVMSPNNTSDLPPNHAWKAKQVPPYIK